MQAKQFLYFKGLFRYEREQSKWILLIRYADNIYFNINVFTFPKHAFNESLDFFYNVHILIKDINIIDSC